MVKRGKEASAGAAGKRDASVSGRRPDTDEPAGGAAGHATQIGDAERLKILDAILENMNEGLFLIDEDFKYVLINPASGRILSHDPKQWVGKRAGGYVHPDDRVRSHETVMRTIQGENSSCEVRIMGSDGKYKHLEMHYSLILVGETFYVLGLVEDITQRKKTEDELRASEEKYRLLADTPSIAMFTLDLRGNIIFVNSTFQNVFGYSTEEASSINFFTVIHDDDLDRAHRQVSLVSRGKGMHNVEYRILTKCGDHVPVLVSASPIHDKNGKVVSILCIANDITDLKSTENELTKYREHLEELVEKRTAKLREEMAERHRANEELRVAKERLEYVLGATKTGFDIVDEDFNVIYVDPTWTGILGKYHGRKCYDYFMGIGQPCGTCAIPQAIKTKNATISEEYLKKEDRYIEVHTIPFKSDDGKWLVAEFNIDVTNRKRADATLRESEEKYRTLFNQASDGIMLMPVDGSNFIVNESCARMHGYDDPAEMESLRLEDLDTEEAAKLAPERLRRMLNGETLHFETQHKHKDGHVIFLQVSCSVIHIGEKAYFQGFHQDITTRKTAEGALVESETKFRELADNSPSMIFINRMGKVVYANMKCSEVMGYAPDEFLADGFDFLSLVAPEDRKRVQENARKRFDGAESAPYEYTLLTKDKKRFEVLINSKPIRYQGQPAILGIITDISHLKRVTTELEESEDTQKNILKMMPDAVVISDLTGKITYASERALELAGYSSIEDVSGTNFIELIAPEDHERAFDDLGRLLKSETHMVTHYTLLRKDGSRYDGEISTTLLKSGMGKVRAILGIVRDVTESRKMENTLRESEEKYRNLVERAADGIVIAQDGKPVFFNERALAMTGYRGENAYSTSMFDAIADDEKPKVAEMYARRMRGEPTPTIYETKLKRLDGSTLPVEINAGVIQYNGKPADMMLIRDLSERKEAEAAHRESELKYRTLFDSANDAIFVADAKTGILVEANKMAERLLGKTRDDIIGTHQSKLHPPEDVDRYEKMFKAHLKDGSAIAGDVYVLRKDGGRVPVMISSHTFVLDGRLVNQGTFHDMSERMELERILRDSETKYKTLFDNAHDAIFLMDGNTFVDCNVKTLEMFHCTREQIIGQPPYKFSPRTQPDGMSSDEKAKELIQAAYAGKSQFFEWTHTHLDGSPFDAEVSLNLVQFKGKDYLLAIVRDITERKRAEGEIIHLKDFSENIIENSPIGIIATDMKGNVTTLNKAMVGILGSPGMDATRKFNILTMPGMVKQGASKYFNDCLKTGKRVTAENVHYGTVWGKDIDVNLDVAPLKDRSGETIGLIALVQDISEKKKAEHELAASEEKLHNIMESMDDMVFGFDTDGKFNFYHSPDKTNLYAKPEMFIGKLHSEILPPHVSMLIAEALVKTRADEVAELEYWLDIGGSEKWFVAKLSPLIDNGKYAGAVAVVRDVTEKKAAEEKLRNSEEQLKALFHASIDGIGVEKGGRFAYVNPSFASIHGYPTPEELYGASAGGLIAPEDRERMAEYSKKRLTGTHAPNRYQYKALKKDGSTFDAEISISQYLLSHELFIVGFVKDVTEQKRRQDDIVKRQILEAQFKLKSVLTDIVPVMLNSMSKDGRADLVEKLSERLDTVLLEKYPADVAPQTIQEVAHAYISVLADLGGASLFQCPDEERCKDKKAPCPEKCSVRITACPWDNQKSRNLLLCILCRGIAWRFASRAKKPLDVHLVKTMADGEKECLMAIETEKD